jgi:hypothetical protein
MGQGFPSQRLGVNISAGTGLAQTGTVVLSNSNGVSFGMSASASSSVITASVSLTTTPAAIAAGTQTGSTGTIIFSNSNGISFGMAGSRTITAQLPSVSLFRPDVEVAGSFTLVPSSGSVNMSIRRFSVPFQISATELDLLANLSVAASTAGSFSLSAAIYTFAGSTASSVSSGSVSVSWNATTTASSSSNYPGQSGTRWRTMSINTWNLTPGEYLMALMGSIAGVAGTTGSMTMFGNSAVSIVGPPGGTGNYSQYFADGLFASGTGAFPTSIHLSAIVQTGSQVLGQPQFRLVGTGP